MTNLDSIFKSRDITLPTKVWLVKAMVFPVVMYGLQLAHLSAPTEGTIYRVAGRVRGLSMGG